MWKHIQSETVQDYRYLKEELLALIQFKVQL